MPRPSCRCVLSLCAAAAACGSLGACGGDGAKKDAAAKPRIVARARASGKRPAAKSAGSVRHPHAVAVRVSAAPKQRVSVVWALSCTNGKTAKQRTSGGSYTTMAPSIRQLRLPQGAASEVCALDATAKILTGRVKATLLATAPPP